MCLRNSSRDPKACPSLRGTTAKRVPTPLVWRSSLPSDVLPSVPSRITSSRGASTSARSAVQASAATSLQQTATTITTTASYDLDESISTHFYSWKFNSQICYYKSGITGGPPIVFLHGFGVGGWHFDRVFPRLSQEGYTCYALDLLGQGRSWPEHPVPADAGLVYSTSMWVEQVTHFIKEHIREPVYVAGNSLGGFLACQLASSSPSLVKGLILLNATPFWSFRPPASDGSDASEPLIWRDLDGRVPVPRNVKSMIEALWWNNLRNPTTVRSMLQLVYAHKPSAADDLMVARIIDATEQAGALDAFTSIVLSPKARLTFSEMLDKVESSGIPVCLAYGKDDPWVVPLWGQRAKRQLKQLATYLEMTPAGHCPHHESANATARCIAEWVAAQEGGQPLPLNVGDSWDVDEEDGQRRVRVTHVDGGPRNFFEHMDYITHVVQSALGKLFSQRSQ